MVERDVTSRAVALFDDGPDVRTLGIEEDRRSSAKAKLSEQPIQKSKTRRPLDRATDGIVEQILRAITAMPEARRWH